MSEKRRQIIKDSSKYLVATVFSQAAGMVRTFAITVILTPAQLGIWNFMNVLVGYGANAHLGLLHGMNKLIPALLAVKDSGRREAVKDSVFWFNSLLGAAASLVALAASYKVSAVYSGALRIAALIIFAQMFFTYFFCLSRAESRFSLVSSGMAANAGLSTFFVLLFAYLHPDPLRGALWGLFASNILTVAYWLYSSGYKFKYQVDMREVRASFHLGIPIIVLGFIDMFFLSIDRWVIAAKLGPEALGYYAIAIMAVNILGLASVSVSNVLFPHMVERHAENKSAAGNENLLLVPLAGTAAAMTLLVFAALIALPPFIGLVLPKYLPSMPLFDILLPAAFFLSLNAIAGTYIIAINKQSALIKIQLVAAAAAFLLDLLFLSRGYGAKGVAYGTLAGYIISGLGYAGFAVYYITRARSAAGIFMLQAVVPLLLMRLAFSLADNYLLAWFGVTGVFGTACVRAAAVGLPLCSVLWLMHRKGRLAGVVAAEWTRIFR